MSGVVVIRALATAHAALTTLVPSARIVSGALPRDVTLPAISLARISGSDLNIPAPGASRFVKDRIQATVHAQNYPQGLAVMKELRRACADKRPDMSQEGLTGVSVHTDGTGPDFINEEASIHLSSQDFMVNYNEVR